MEKDQDSQKPERTSDLSECRQLYQDRLTTAKLRKGSPPPADEHPWVRSARLAKDEDGTYTEKPEPDGFDKEDRAMMWGVMVMTLSMIISVAVGLWMFRSLQPANPPAVSPEQPITVWHDGKKDETQLLQRWIAQYTKISKAKVRLVAQANLSGSLVQAAAANRGPSLAIVSQDLALRLYQGGVLKELSPVPNNSKTNELKATLAPPIESYYVPLSQETVWTRTQVMVVPRGLTAAEEARRFALFVKEKLSLPINAVAF